MYFFFPLCLFGAEINLEGFYQGENLYILNPSDGQGGFCITKILLNHEERQQPATASAFMLDLSHLAYGDSISLKILHKDGCKPKIMNPNAIRVRHFFSYQAIAINQRELTWVTKGEEQGGSFEVLRLSGNKWVVTDKWKAKGNEAHNLYVQNLVNQQGINRYKIKYISPDGKTHLSPVLEFKAATDPNSMTSPTSGEVAVEIKKNKIYLSEEISYRIFNETGQLVKQGKGKTIDTTDLEKGAVYHLIYGENGLTFRKG